MSDTKILFVKHHSANAKFVMNDFDLLKKNYSADMYDAEITSNISAVFGFMKQFFFLLFKIHRYKLVYVWFADYHSLLPVFFAKVFSKKSVIAAGGYDATYIPEIDMGVFTKSTFKKRLRCFSAAYSLKNCSLVIPVDESLIENVNNYVYSDLPGKPALKDGIKNMIPEIKTNFKTIHLGYDPRLFKKISGLKKERAVVSAGFIMNENEFKRKGFDLLVKAAKIMDEVRFILIGLNDFYFEKLGKLNLENLELYKKVNYEKLISLYSRAKIYSQLSLFEGMPSAVCEAMLCECIPVGSDVNGIPEIIGNCGIIVKQKNLESIVKSFEHALNYDESFGLKSRIRIMEKFPLQKREAELTDTVNSLLA